MMLRPTSTSENSSRGNTAYGQSSNYYDPNDESNGKYNLHGDVARIFLYVYVRWGNRNSAWGTSGVMENVDVLLAWMEEAFRVLPKKSVTLKRPSTCVLGT